MHFSLYVASRRICPSCGARFMFKYPDWPRHTRIFVCLPALADCKCGLNRSQISPWICFRPKMEFILCSRTSGITEMVCPRVVFTCISFLCISSQGFIYISLFESRNTVLGYFQPFMHLSTKRDVQLKNIYVKKMAYFAALLTYQKRPSPSLSW